MARRDEALFARFPREVVKADPAAVVGGANANEAFVLLEPDGHGSVAVLRGKLAFRGRLDAMVDDVPDDVDEGRHERLEARSGSTRKSPPSIVIALMSLPFFSARSAIIDGYTCEEVPQRNASERPESLDDLLLPAAARGRLALKVEERGARDMDGVEVAKP